MNESTTKSSKNSRRELLVLLVALSLFIIQANRSHLSNIFLPTIGQWDIGGPEDMYDQQKCSSSAAAKVEQVIQRLTKNPMPRYYVYEDDRFEPQMELPALRERQAKELRFLKKRYEGFVEGEEHIINTLANSSLRTRDLEEADLFFVPISLTRHLIMRRPKHHVAKVFDALYNQTIFQSTQGHRHFMIVQTPNMWSWEHTEIYRKGNMQISQQYPKLWNVTIGKVFDQEGCEEAQNKGLLEGSAFKPVMLDCAVAMSRSSFSLNFITLPTFPFVRASMEKFRNSSWDCFYHSRKRSSLFQSTPYRHALLNKTIWEALPGSSIGFDIKATVWMEHFVSSRFCLVIRGDNPLSRSHLRAVKVGCIPVIVSNMLEYYAPIFKSLIAVSDYSIMVDEDEFLADPVAALMKVNNMSEKVLCEKVEYLKLAQQLLIPDHPESLFVPALLHQVNESMKRASNHSHWPLRFLMNFYRSKH
jgi:Exostosin family